MLISSAERGSPIIYGFISRLSGYAVIFYPGKAPLFRRRQIAPEILEVQVKAYVPVEIAIARISGVTFMPAPNLFG